MLIKQNRRMYIIYRHHLDDSHRTVSRKVNNFMFYLFIYFIYLFFNFR
jgi:hypothetical protein